MRAAGERDGLEPRVDAERAEQAADVVPHGLRLEVELGGDLGGRAAVLEQAEHLRLARREVRVQRRRRLVGALDDLAEDADHAIAAHAASPS